MQVNGKLFTNSTFQTKQGNLECNQCVPTHNLIQAQDPGSYAQLIQLQISLASKPPVPGKRGTFV